MKHQSGFSKPFIVFLCLFAVYATDIIAQPVYGTATLFDYNADGTRKERRTEPYTIISPKPGRGGGEPIDTLTQEFDKNILGADKEVIVRAYPNPVTNMLIVENLSWNGTNNIVIKLFDITGKHLLTKTTNSAKEQVPFSNYPPGTYHVHYYINERLLTDWKIIKNN